VQDALLGFIAKPPAREIRNVAAWITVVASNRMRDVQRSRAAEARAVVRLRPHDAGYSDSLRSLDLDLVAALEALPEGQREVCVLHYLLDHSIETIAEGLGVTTGSVKTQLHRARKALAKTVRREDHRG